MPVKIAAGCLVRARFAGQWHYLIVHPSGRYNKKRPYSIAKGIRADTPVLPPATWIFHSQRVGQELVG